MYCAHANYFPPIPLEIEDLSFCGPLFEQYTLTKKYKQRFLLFDGWQEIRNKKMKLLVKSASLFIVLIMVSDYYLKRLK